MINFGSNLNKGKKNVKYFVTSDLHFFHKNIIRFCPETRPFNDLEDMHECIINHWNSIVGEDDVVFSLGDFSFGNAEQTEGIISKLNGTIIFILGNHCKVFRNQLSNKYQCLDYLEVKYNGTKVCMGHYAPRVWNQSHRGSVYLWGHSHGSLESFGRSIDVGIDAHGKILSLDEAVDMCLTNPIHLIDQH